MAKCTDQQWLLALLLPPQILELPVATLLSFRVYLEHKGANIIRCLLGDVYLLLMLKL